VTITIADGSTYSIGIFVFHPVLPGNPKARFPGVVVFSEIYQGELRGGL
jgi:carboxymethylenebutenolidase